MAKNKKKRLSMIDVESISSYSNKRNNRISILRDDNRTPVFGAPVGSLTSSQSKVRKIVKEYRKEGNQKTLRKVSEDLAVQSQQYQRLLNFYANMPLYAYSVVPFKDISTANENKLKKELATVTEFLSRLNPKYNFSKIVKLAMTVDIFYGYVIDDKESVMIQQFPNDICKISSVSGGVYNYVIDLDALISADIVDYYPQEIQDAVNKYNTMKKGNNKSASNWYEIQDKNSICIKINESSLIPVPPFAGTFDSIYDIHSFKDLRNDKAELQNYKLLIQKLETRSSNDNNDFTLDMPMMNYFHEALSMTVPDNVGVVTSPMEIDTVSFDKDSSTDDSVEKATKNFWDNAGVSQILFSSDNKTSQGIAMSIATDEQFIFGILNQLERWLNRYMLLNGMSKYFKATMLEVTHFSKKEAHDKYITDAQYGFPVKVYLASLMGIDPVAFTGLLKVENEILDLPEIMTPLSSSFNTSGSDIAGEAIKETGKENGRPTNETTGNKDSDETQRSKDKPANTQ
ncbi:hypothetical protein LW81_170 [Lactococcus phage LW81]|uniref:Portal protein n=1 Tax=Lactococcus phage LW81 TaxID=1965482 RepID=A0A1W6JNB8_9CAUD|nr:portal protein [Lactococcus phage LW81]ARM67740.1 hypothetical protein LW81_170 [Lactococcus phage LW81]